MRILQVVHNFLPAPLRGSETFTLHLCRELRKRHEVSIFHRVADLRQPEYATESRITDGFPVRTVNQTFRRISSFQLSYDDPSVNRIFEAALRELEPEVVHFQHVAWMSIGMIPLAKAYGARVVYTLHDYYLICQAGQLVHRHGHICDGGRDKNCVNCRSPLAIGWRNLTTLILNRLRPVPATSGEAPRKGDLADKLLAAWAGVRYTLGTTWRSSRRDVAARWRLVDEVLRDVDLFLSPSDYVRQRFIDAGVDEARVFTCLNGYPERSAPERPEIGDDPGRPLRIGYIGSMIPTKGVHVLIEAFKRLTPRESCPVELLLYGVTRHEPAYARKLRVCAGDHPAIQFKGEFPHSELEEIYAELDLLVLPSVWLENAPLVLNEGFQLGVPSVGARLGGIPELIEHERSGLLFEPGDSGDLARCLQRVVDRPSLLDTFRKNLPRPRSIADCAAEHERRYAALLDSTR